APALRRQAAQGYFRRQGQDDAGTSLQHVNAGPQVRRCHSRKRGPLFRPLRRHGCLWQQRHGHVRLQEPARSRQLEHPVLPEKPEVTKELSMTSLLLLVALARVPCAAQEGPLEIANARATYGYLGATHPKVDGRLPGDVVNFTFDIKNLKL